MVLPPAKTGSDNGPVVTTFDQPITPFSINNEIDNHNGDKQNLTQWELYSQSKTQTQSHSGINSNWWTLNHPLPSLLSCDDDDQETQCATISSTAKPQNSMLFKSGYQDTEQELDRCDNDNDDQTNISMKQNDNDKENDNISENPTLKTQCTIKSTAQQNTTPKMKNNWSTVGILGDPVSMQKQYQHEQQQLELHLIQKQISNDIDQVEKELRESSQIGKNNNNITGTQSQSLTWSTWWTSIYSSANSGSASNSNATSNRQDMSDSESNGTKSSSKSKLPSLGLWVSGTGIQGNGNKLIQLQPFTGSSGDGNTANNQQYQRGQSQSQSRTWGLCCILGGKRSSSTSHRNQSNGSKCKSNRQSKSRQSTNSNNTSITNFDSSASNSRRHSTNSLFSLATGSLHHSDEDDLDLDLSAAPISFSNQFDGPNSNGQYGNADSNNGSRRSRMSGISKNLQTVIASMGLGLSTSQSDGVRSNSQQRERLSIAKRISSIGWMGKKRSSQITAAQLRKDPSLVKLSPELSVKIDQAFSKMDKDNSRTIDTAEAMNMFRSFGKLNTKVLREEMDVNNDGLISYEEWVHYFKRVACTGKYTDDDIIDEINNFLEGQQLNTNSGGFFHFDTQTAPATATARKQSIVSTSSNATRTLLELEVENTQNQHQEDDNQQQVKVGKFQSHSEAQTHKFQQSQEQTAPMTENINISRPRLSLLKVN